MEKVIEKFYDTSSGQGIEIYEQSHAPRFDFLMEDLDLSSIKNSSILDVGCGYGPIFNRMNPDNHNDYVGVDGASVENSFEYHVADLNYDKFSDCFTGRKFNYIFSFETFEHLSNPYHCLLEIKKLMDKDSIFYLSIPHECVTHNTIYPSLIYPVDNFIKFLEQCAMEVVDVRIHNKSFVQNVFTLKSLGWENSKLRWPKHEDKFQGIPPHEAINL